MEGLTSLEKTAFVGTAVRTAMSVLRKPVVGGLKMAFNPGSGSLRQRLVSNAKWAIPLDLIGSAIGPKETQKVWGATRNGLMRYNNGTNVNNMYGVNNMPGLSSLNKTASGRVIGTLKDPIVGAVAASLALEGIGAVTDKISEFADKRKFHKVIDYAKKKHPELRNIPRETMMDQMDAFYALAPRAAVNKELGSSMLATTNDYGGNVDLATAKLLSDIGRSSNSGGSREAILASINTGTNVIKGTQYARGGNDKNGGKKNGSSSFNGGRRK